MAEVRTLRTATLGRYLVEGADVDAPLLLGFHGYGQNAEQLLTELRRIPGAARWTLVAVQALHRFYDRRTQEVVGSWMTRLDRDQAIEDNGAYVRRVVEALRAEGRRGPLVFAGFSQGAAMAWRAAAATPCAGLLVLGGGLPGDVTATPLPPVLLGRGETDSFYTAPMLATDLAALTARGVTPEVVRFAGGHEWHPAFLDAAGRFLARIAP